MAVPCTVLTDRSFGPGVKCEQFDFTLTFEQAIFGIGVSALLLILIPLRILRVFNEERKTTQNSIYYSKIVRAVRHALGEANNGR